MKITGANLQFPMLSHEHVPDVCCSMSQVFQGGEESVSTSTVHSSKDGSEEVERLCDEELEFGEFLKDAAEWL